MNKKHNDYLWIHLIYCLVIGLLTITIIVHMNDGNVHKTKQKTTIIRDIGCKIGGYPTYDNMICEDGVLGDINNNYGGFIWYCGEKIEQTKKCMHIGEKYV